VTKKPRNCGASQLAGPGRLGSGITGLLPVAAQTTGPAGLMLMSRHARFGGNAGAIRRRPETAAFRPERKPDGVGSTRSLRLESSSAAL